MMTRVAHIIGLLSCLALIASCFLPWVHYNSINDTFTGFHVDRFPTGNYYGKAGKSICWLTGIIFLLMFVNKVWAKRINLFAAAILFAYTIRTYIIFTSALFEGEVEKKIGIYMIVLCSGLLLISTVFPKVTMKEK